MHHDDRRERGEPEERLGYSLEENLAEFRRRFGDADDLLIRSLRLGFRSRQQAAVVYLAGIANEELIAGQIIRPLTVEARRLFGANDAPADPALLAEALIPVAAVECSGDWADLSVGPCDGAAVLLIEGCAEALILQVREDLARSITEPESKPVIRGPREGFIEDLQANVALIRRRIRTSDLWVETLTLGRRSRTRVAVLHLHGMAKESLLQEVRVRLKRIELDAVLESGYLEELIQDQPLALFPTIQHSERVDVVLGSLLEGRVAIVTDGTPFVLIVPATFLSLMQVSEDYYERWPIGTFIRWVRYGAVAISLTLTGLYVSVTSFNQELLPFGLVLRVAGNRIGLPFPAVAEALLLEGAFEILREAGLRMPRNIGQAISIVGVLVLGEAAVRAGIVGPVMIIVVGAGALASFAIPEYSMVNAFRVARFGVIALSGVFGLFGLMVGVLLVVTHLLTLRSFGVPYLAPLAPTEPRPLFREGLGRAPWWALDRRWGQTAGDVRRESPGQRPGESQSAIQERSDE